MSSNRCIYLNTSILIKAVNPRDPNREAAERILRECCSRYTCVYSSIHGLEPWRPETRMRVRALLRSLGAQACRVDSAAVAREAARLRLEWGIAMSRAIDIAHLVAARRCGCIMVMAVDRFIRARSALLGLGYVNYYTGCP